MKISDQAPSSQQSSISVRLLLITLPPLFWAGNFIVGRATRGNIPPFSLSLWRWTLAMAIILPFALKYLKKDLNFYKENIWLVTRLSLTGVVGFTCLAYIGLRETTAANALLLNSCVPVLIAFFGAAFYRQRLQIFQSAGLLLSCVGVVVIISNGNMETLLSLTFSRGDLIIFCAMISFAFYTLWSRRVPAEINRIGLMAAQVAVALLFLIPLWLIELSKGVVTNWSEGSLIALLYLGVFPSVVGYILFTMAVTRFGAAQAALSIHLIPVFGAILAVTFLGESLHIYHAIGMTAILAGIQLGIKSPPQQIK